MTSVLACLRRWCVHSASGKDAVHAIDRAGTPQPTHTCWKGFKRGTAVGLVLERRMPAPVVPTR